MTIVITKKKMEIHFLLITIANYKYVYHSLNIEKIQILQPISTYY